MEKKPIIGIIGYGMVGSAIQFGFSNIADFRIYDINPVISINTLEEVCKDSDYIFVCVPTPMKLSTGEIDLSIVDDTVDKCMRLKREDNIVIIKSTIIPGTTLGYNKKYNTDKIIFNPEFLTARSHLLDFINQARIIIGGINTDILKRLYDLYRLRFPSTKVFLTDPTSAELAKYASNCILAVKVAFCNELYQICQKSGIPYDRIKKLILADGRIGNSHMEVPGHDGQFGFGGMCFPKDINAFIGYAKSIGINPSVMIGAWDKNIEVRENKDWLKIKGAVSENE